MKEYRTIIVVDSKIHKKIELYRQFLEKSEFGTNPERALFITDDSVEELSSTELNKAESFIYLYGALTRDEYAAYYNAIEEKRNKYQNAAFYMLFCQDATIGEPYGDSILNESNLLRTFSVEIREDTGTDDTELLAELRCIKLLTLALAIAKFNEERIVEFESFYMNACVTPDYKNIYYSIMHSLSEEADEINSKRRKITLNTAIIDFLKKKRNSKCKVEFGDFDSAAFNVELKPFSQYGKMNTLQRDMEIAYNAACTATDEAVTRSINVARKALAIEEAYPPEFVEVINDGSVDFSVTERASLFQDYMTATEVSPEHETEVAQPADLLSRPFANKGFAFYSLRSVFPLANHFEKNRNENLGPTFIATLCFALISAGIPAIIYLFRYLSEGGLVGVNRNEVMTVCAISAGAIILAGIVALFVQLFRRMRCKKFFKEIYTRLMEFVNGRTKFISLIREYIDKYITVYYNNHIKHSRIEAFYDENEILEHEILLIEKKVSPANAAAEVVCRLNGGRISLPTLSPDRREGSDSLSMKKCLEKSVEAKTEITGDENVYNTVTPWAEKIAYGRGNLNSGGGI